MVKKYSQRSTPQSVQPKDAVCDICGDVGVAELITTCSKCKTSCEHAYCRKVPTQNYRDDWLCDNCNVEKKGPCEKREKCVTSASEPHGFERSESTRFAHRGKHYLKERFVNKGKVKNISTQEAIRLCSGSRKGETIKHYNPSGVKIDSLMHSKTVVHKNETTFKSPVTPVSLSNSLQTSSIIKRQVNRKFARDAVKPAEIKLAIPGKEMHKPSDASSVHSLENQLMPQVSSVATTPAVEARAMPKEVTCAFSLKRRFKELSASDEGKPATKTPLASSGKEIRNPSEASSANSLEKQFLQPVGSVAVAPSVETRAVRQRREAGVMNEAAFAPSLTKHLKKPKTFGHQVESDKFSRGPAQASSWKGQFKFLDDILRSTKFENVAHTCSITSRKVLEFSRRMPRQLQFKLIRRNTVWTNLFQDGCANENDIGLYFYSGEKDRSSGYDLVLALIEAKDLALKCELHGVVLYLFTSKTLSADYQTWDGHHYLWGVLHKLKRQKDVTELYKELPPKVL